LNTLFPRDLGPLVGRGQGEGSKKYIDLGHPLSQGEGRVRGVIPYVETPIFPQIFCTPADSHIISLPFKGRVRVGMGLNKLRR